MKTRLLIIIGITIFAASIFMVIAYIESFEKEKKPERKGNLGLINPEKDIPVFFEVMLMEQNVQWKMPQRDWANPDFEIKAPARVCSQIVFTNGTSAYLSTMLQNPYTLSNMAFHDTLPEDCAKVLPVTEIGRK